MKRRANDLPKKCHFEYSDLIFKRKKIKNNFEKLFENKLYQNIENMTPEKRTKMVKISKFGQIKKIGQQYDPLPEFETKR